MAISIIKLLAAIKDSFDKHGELGEADVLNTVRDASLLVLDDLGVEYKTAWAYEKLYTHPAYVTMNSQTISSRRYAAKSKIRK